MIEYHEYLPPLSSRELLKRFMETGDYSLINPDLLPNGKRKPRTVAKEVGRNEPCICGSGKKYKKCCGK